MPHTKAAKAFTALIIESFQWNGRLLAAGDRLTKPLGLTSARWQVLGAITTQNLPVAQIARNMGLARQNVQRLADALEKDGIIEYAINPDHKRAKLVCLTRRGRKIMNDLDTLQITWANGVTDKIPATEIQAACELIKKLRSRLEKSRLQAAAPGTRSAK